MQTDTTINLHTGQTDVPVSAPAIEGDRRLWALVNASSDAVYRMSADWGTMYQLKVDHCLAETVEANSRWLQEHIHPEDQPRVQATIREAIPTKSVFDA